MTIYILYWSAAGAVFRGVSGDTRNMSDARDGVTEDSVDGMQSLTALATFASAEEGDP
jgi:hypothetical protein